MQKGSAFAAAADYINYILVILSLYVKDVYVGKIVVYIHLLFMKYCILVVRKMSRAGMRTSKF